MVNIMYTDMKQHTYIYIREKIQECNGTYDFQCTSFCHFNMFKATFNLNIFLATLGKFGGLKMQRPMYMFSMFS